MTTNIQEFAETAGNYKQLTLGKNLAKKRGRACNRREKREVSIDGRIMRDLLAASFARREFRKEMNQFEKTVHEASGRGVHDIPMPSFLQELRGTFKLAEANLVSAKASKAAMQAFPPL